MAFNSIEQLDPREYILIKGARVHNLKNIDLALPQKKLIVITGVSGSGKSSLAFDTLYAEGQRRYVESLSSYARQFLGRLNKPEVEWIKGISPAVAVEQKVTSRNPRSTVGTSTEIYDYMKVLYARIGKTISPVSGTEVKRHQVGDVLEDLMKEEEGRRFYVLAPISKPDRKLIDQLKLLLQQGYSRVKWDGGHYSIEDLIERNPKEKADLLYITIDRGVVKHNDEDNDARLADSIQTAFFEGHGTCLIEFADNGEHHEFSNRFEADGIVFEEPTPHLFSFNNPFGACPKCEGFGSVIGIDEDLVVPNQNLSIYEDAIVAWKGEKMQEWKDLLIKNAQKIGFPIHRPYFELKEEERDILWIGKGGYPGLNQFFKYLESKSYKIQYRVMLSRYRGKTKCPVCEGKRLRKEATYVKVDGRSITELVDLPIDRLSEFFNDIQLSDHDQKIAERLLLEIRNRLRYLKEVGLGYLTMNRLSNTLSGGESQRINLATYLGSSLVGSMYILDEPSIGLHPRDTNRLVNVVRSLRDIGNTVIVVEHDEEFMRAADLIVDIGPGAGSHGGEVIFRGTLEEIMEDHSSLTGQYLAGTKEIEVPAKRRPAKNFLEVIGARENNLKNISVKFPLNAFTVVTGVSGSGKTSLIKKILFPGLKKLKTGYGEKPGKHQGIIGAIDKVSDVEFVDQNPIGKSSRSNPVTYLKAYDEIRELFASQQLSKIHGFKPKHFSFNTDGGRCDVCKGEGTVTIEMQFMADVHLTCEQCNGRRFKEEVLDVKFQGKSIYDILELTVDDAIGFFHEHGQKKIVDKLKPLQDVGLGYVHLGQPSSTLSGGEAQRIKLASFLVKGQSDHSTLFIFDEPTTGLHFEDINKLLASFNALIRNGHSILVIEHNPEVIKSADWIIDLGPEGGEDGGNLVFQGTPEDLVKATDSHTAPFIAEKIGQTQKV